MMNDMYKVSVIIPTYNAEEYLSDLIAILRKQTLQDIEMIFVDDGSSDNGKEVIHEAMKEDSRISYYYQDNSGAGVARNTGLSHAQGKYVIWIDADDLYDENMIEELYNAAESASADAVMCLFRRYNYWTNEQTEDEGYRKDKLPLDQVFCGKDIDRFCEWFNPGPINKMYRREYIIENGLRYSSTRIANDVVFGCGAMMLAERVYCLSKNLLTVRRYVNENSISSTRKTYLEQSVQAIDELWAWAKSKELLDGPYKDQLVKKFGVAVLYNCTYGVNEKFWDASCAFIETMKADGVPESDIKKMFAINTQKFEKRIAELKQSPETEKEVEMLEYKVDFIKRMKEHLDIKDEVKKVAKTAVKEKAVETKKVEEKKTEEKAVVAQPAAPLSLKSRIALKIKRVLGKIWPVTINRFNARFFEQQKLLKKGFKDNQREIVALKKEIQKLNKEQALNLELYTRMLEQQEKLLSGQAMLFSKYDVLLEKHRVEEEKLFAISQDTQVIHDVKQGVENSTRAAMEGVWADVFNSTINNSSWLLEQTFSPGRWAVGYQCLYAMYRILDEAKPKRILELGLGQSTRMISQYAATHEGVEHVVIENDANWVEFFKNAYDMPACSRIEVCEHEMVAYKDADEVRVYKDFAEKLKGMQFDFIIIDAPKSGDMKRFARIDVLRMMPECLSENFVILMDDYNRACEIRTVRQMENVLKENGIPYKRGKYSGLKDCAILCAESLQFLATL